MLKSPTVVPYNRNLMARPAGVTRPQTALVVDDDKQVLSLVGRWLKNAGYEVSTCDDFGAAKQRVRDGGSEVLIVDVRLQGFNGIHLAILARELRPETRIVVLSGWDDAVLRQEANACGATYLCKPLKAEQLLAAIEAPPQAAS
jgi:DNA-binding response OmpR family regulator